MLPTFVKNRPLAAADEQSMELILTQTVTVAVASIDFTENIDDTFDSYLFILNAVRPVNDNIDLRVRTSQDGISFDSGANDYFYEFQRNGSSQVSSTAGVAQILMAQAMGNAAEERGCSGSLVLHNPSVAANRGHMTFQSSFFVNTANTMSSLVGGGSRRLNSVVKGLRFTLETGNFDSGSISMYGVRG